MDVFNLLCGVHACYMYVSVSLLHLNSAKAAPISSMPQLAMLVVCPSFMMSLSLYQVGIIEDWLQCAHMLEVFGNQAGGAVDVGVVAAMCKRLAGMRRQWYVHVGVMFVFVVTFKPPLVSVKRSELGCNSAMCCNSGDCTCCVTMSWPVSRWLLIFVANLQLR